MELQEPSPRRLESWRSAAEAVACKFTAPPSGGAGHAELFVRISESQSLKLQAGPASAADPCPKFPKIDPLSDLTK